MKQLKRDFMMGILLFGVVVAESYAASYGKIELIRDQWGVPHIFSETDIGAMYGLGYATAEDRAFQMHFNLRIVQGRLSEVVGEMNHRKRGVTSVTQDIKYRTLGVYRSAKEVAKNLDGETKNLLQAYCDGVNDHIREHPEELLYLFRQYGLEPEEWTAADCLVSWWHMGMFFSGEGLHDTMVYHRLKEGRGQFDRAAMARRGGRGGRGRQSERIETKIDLEPIGPDDAAAVVQPEDISEEWLQKVNEFAEKHGILSKSESGEQGPKFSHAWVLGGKKTTTGSSVLCSDPQTPVRNPSMFYEYHIQGKTFNARGIGVPGSPIILIGWSENVAWGLTALGADQADQFLLNVDPDKPNQYFYEGEWQDMTVWEETIKVKNGEDKTLVLKETHLGPVVSSIAHDVREGEEAVLKRVPMCIEDRETIQGFFSMIRAKNVDEFSHAIEGWLFPSANIVFGDREGNIAYWTLGAMPVRSRHALDEGRASHLGTANKYDWRGYVPYELLPHVVNPERGFLQTANHRPIGSFYPLPIGISTGSGGDTDRSWRLRERLRRKEKFTPEEVKAVHYDCVNPAKREIVRLGYFLRDVQKAKLSEDTLKTLDYLEEWYEEGARSDMTVKGTEVANVINTMFRLMQSELTLKYGGGQSGLSLFLKTVKEKHKKEPKAELNELEVAFIDETLANAWSTAESRYGRNPDQWLSVAREQLDRQILGYFESLDGYSSLDEEKDLTFPMLTCIDGGTILSQTGQSYSQWVPMHDIDSAQSILPIGQSEHPDSPYRMSTYDLWSQGKYHPAPLSREGVEKVMASYSELSN